MRFLPLAILTAALFSTACSHETKKADAIPETPAPAVIEKNESPKPQAAAESTKVECSVKGDTRIIEVRAKDKGCELAYTKAGKEGVVASAAHGTEYCENALEKLRDKLAGSGYDCK